MAGLDISPGLLRERVPHADLVEGDLESLPWPDDSVDAVVGINAFRFAGDVPRAFAEAARVSRGPVVASLFAAPERCESTVVHHAMSALIPPDQASEHAPHALSEHLEEAMAPLQVTRQGEVECAWAYASMDDAVLGLLCSAGGARAVEAAGEEAVRAALAPSRTPPAP